MALVYPSVIADTDPRVVHALDFIASAFRAKFALTDASRFDATAPRVRQLTTVQASQQAQPPASASVPATTAATAPGQQGKNCERKPIWGLRVSAFCYPSGICNDLVIKDYETVCH
jgi:hypothetical protein